METFNPFFLNQFMFNSTATATTQPTAAATAQHNLCGDPGRRADNGVAMGQVRFFIVRSLTHGFPDDTRRPFNIKLVLEGSRRTQWDEQREDEEGGSRRQRAP